MKYFCFGSPSFPEVKATCKRRVRKRHSKRFEKTPVHWSTVLSPDGRIKEIFVVRMFFVGSFLLRFFFVTLCMGSFCCSRVFEKVLYFLGKEF